MKDIFTITDAIEYKGIFIHPYQTFNGVQTYCIGINESEVFTDHEECIYWDLKKEEYQKILKSFNAKQFHHEFVYSKDDVLPVQDSYFENMEDVKRAIDYLLKK